MRTAIVICHRMCQMEPFLLTPSDTPVEMSDHPSFREKLTFRAKKENILI